MRICKENLFDCAVDLLIAAGESHEGAQIVAESLCISDAKGITTHGTYLLTPIFKRVKAGQLSLPTITNIVIDNAAVAVVDGGDGLGPIAGKLAANLAIQRAQTYGVGVVLIRNTNSVGSLAYYTEMVAKEGMLAFMSCNAAPAMAPWGGAEPFTGTNPIAFAVYTGKDLLFSADMATSIVARGKIRQAARRGEPIPSEWAIDPEGNLTTDPAAALKGTLLPMAGPKGSAIALMVDILSGIIAGAQHAPDLRSFHATEGKTGVGASLIALDIQKFIHLNEFEIIMDDYVHSLKSMKTANFAKEIYLPGEIEYMNEQESNRLGINLEDSTVKALNDLLDQFSSNKQLEVMSKSSQEIGVI